MRVTRAAAPEGADVAILAVVAHGIPEDSDSTHMDRVPAMVSVHKEPL